MVHKERPTHLSGHPPQTQQGKTAPENIRLLKEMLEKMNFVSFHHVFVWIKLGN